MGKAIHCLWLYHNPCQFPLCMRSRQGLLLSGSWRHVAPAHPKWRHVAPARPQEKPQGFPVFPMLYMPACGGLSGTCRSSVPPCKFAECRCCGKWGRAGAASLRKTNGIASRNPVRRIIYLSNAHAVFCTAFLFLFHYNTLCGVGLAVAQDIQLPVANYLHCLHRYLCLFERSLGTLRSLGK